MIPENKTKQHLSEPEWYPLVHKLFKGPPIPLDSAKINPCLGPNRGSDMVSGRRSNSGKFWKYPLSARGRPAIRSGQVRCSGLRLNLRSAAVSVASRSAAAQPSGLHTLRGIVGRCWLTANLIFLWTTRYRPIKHVSVVG
jgi:hypothetical protein